MILDKDIKLKVNSAYLQHLTDLGYRNIKMGEIITIPINHLKNGSHTEINVKCDICGRKKILSYRVYFKNIKRGNFYSCSNKCARKHINDNKKIIINNYN